MINILLALLPVLPGLSGYGVETPAGRGGIVYRVNSLAESGVGTLGDCIAKSVPRVCVFETSGTIQLTKDLVIRNPYITIAGQTAPSPGIQLRGGAIQVSASDVLVQHLHVRAGDDPVGHDPENRDSMKIEQAKTLPIIERIVMDHNSFEWAIDETGSAYSGWNNVTLSNNIYGPPLTNSIHPKGPHGYNMITGPTRSNITLTGNLYLMGTSRNPLANAEHMVFINNVVYDWVNMATDMQGQLAPTPTFNTVQGNHYKRGVDSSSNKPIDVRADATAIPPGSKVYVWDNWSTEMTADPWSVVRELGGNIPDDYRSSVPLNWNKGLTAYPTKNDYVLNTVLRNVGARPADRDSSDAKFIGWVRTGSGTTINCVASDGTTRCNRNAGGWPSYPVNKRTLNLPADPNHVNADGYTNLEHWLHDYAEQVEGKGQQPNPPTWR